MNIYQCRFVVYFVQRRGPAIASRLTLNLRNHPAPRLIANCPDKGLLSVTRPAAGKKVGRAFVDVLTESERTENGVSSCSESVLKR